MSQLPWETAHDFVVKLTSNSEMTLAELVWRIAIDTRFSQYKDKDDSGRLKLPFECYYDTQFIENAKRHVRWLEALSTEECAEQANSYRPSRVQYDEEMSRRAEQRRRFEAMEKEVRALPIFPSTLRGSVEHVLSMALSDAKPYEFTETPLRDGEEWRTNALVHARREVVLNEQRFSIALRDLEEAEAAFDALNAMLPIPESLVVRA